MRKTVRVKKMADIEAVFPGFGPVWRAIKEATGTRCRAPKSVSFTDLPSPMVLHDYECGKRFPLNLETMELGEGIHVSAGEWAIHAGRNHTEEVRGVPENMALLSCSWNDFHRYFSVEVLVKKLPPELEAANG